MSPDLSTIDRREVPAAVVRPIASLLREEGLDVWLYSADKWYVLDENGAHVEREASTVQFHPEVVQSYDELSVPIMKMVGVSDDLTSVATAGEKVREQFGDSVSAGRSQPYYLDVTHPDANKGSVIEYLSNALGIRLERIACIGDMPSDVPMFARSGISIAMGNASDDVKRRAQHVTGSNEEDGFSSAMEQFVLAGASPSS